jgi:hypothetical protein
MASEDKELEQSLAAVAVLSKLAEEIQAYESDTFYGGDLSFDQAMKIAVHMVKTQLTDELGHNIDGVMLTEWSEAVGEQGNG